MKTSGFSVGGWPMLASVIAVAIATPCIVSAQRATLSRNVRQYVTVDTPTVALTHVRVIDGTGAPPRADQTLILRDGKIAEIGNAASITAPAGAQIIDLTGKSVIPGLVMMHEHLFYPTGPGVYGNTSESFTRLYLAGGVTSMRTGGNMNGYGEINIATAIKRGLKITGHLCSVTYREAAAAGIDNLEHGFFVSTDFDASKKPDLCPGQAAGMASLAAVDPNSAEFKSLISDLIAHHVALTSTLTVFETFTPGQPMPPGLDVLDPILKQRFEKFYASVQTNKSSIFSKLFAKDRAMEVQFVRAGGLLIAGTDPTGAGGVIPGYSDQRQVELLVGSGFTPLEAIKICTLNGATYMGRANLTGSIAQGKQADLVVINGDPSTNISDIRKVETVFRQGVGYDPARLIASVKGQVGLF